MDPSSMVFFAVKDLRVGKIMASYFPNRDPSTSPRYCLEAREEADSIPFALDELPHILELFSFSPDSPQAKATHWNSMLDFTHAILGSESHFQVLTTSPPYQLIDHPFPELRFPENAGGNFSSQDGSKDIYAYGHRDRILFASLYGTTTKLEKPKIYRAATEGQS
ncbi:BURP domain-containing protein 3 [Morella rubra]|uniref:BURP domain-containing protein 3 n=1 Tax=Morella rubra TaxID=262757 RepID=A0A6A1V622_9ROSI|nr:BURP domain-containing protein 3 [Morella rubra]